MVLWVMVKNHEPTPAGKALSDLILDIFRVSNQMTIAGDRLVSDLGLTSARWQVLGSMIAAERAQPVAWLARDMGMSRQNLQRIIYDLERGGLVALLPNPHHKRAPLVAVTAQGQDVFAAAMALQTVWVNDLVEGLDADDIAITHRVIAALGTKLGMGGG